MMTGSFDNGLTLRTERNSLKEDYLITRCLKNPTANSKLASGQNMGQLTPRK